MPSRRAFLSGAAAVGLGLAATPVLAACSGSGSSSAGGGRTQVTWAIFGSPSDLGPEKSLSDAFNKKHPKVQAKMLALPQDNYTQKIQSELVSHTAPDVFYTGDTMAATLIHNQSLASLGTLLAGTSSEEKQQDFAKALLPVAQGADGSLFGVPTDCNPMTLWYNTRVLQAAGISEEPAQTFASGGWTLDAFQNIVDKVRKTKKQVLVFSNWNGETYPWITSRGGTIFSDGRFVGNEDPHTVEAVTWLREMITSKAFFYAPMLAQGQSADAMLMADQIAFTAAGRWAVPTYQPALGAHADIVPHPTADGSLPQTFVIGSWMVINKQSKHVEAAFEFLTDYVSKAGQIARLEGAKGVAVPTVAGADQVVLSGNYPAHAQTFLDLRDHGYSSMVEETRVPAITNNIFAPLDKFFTHGGDAKKVLDGIAGTVNAAIDKAN